MRELPKLTLDLSKPETFGNVAEQLNADERPTLANDLIELIGVDETSMAEWLGEAKGFLDSVEADRGNETPENREQEGSGEEPPPSTEMMLSAVIQFSAKATGALLGEPDLAKTSEPGGEPLAAWVSSQLRTKDPNWVLDTDPLIVHLGVTGLSWRMRDFEEDEKEFTSHFLPCTDVIINKNVRSVERAPRITWQYERYPYEIERSIQRGHWIDYGPLFEDSDPQAPKRFYQVDAWLDLDGDGIDEPWTITISRDDMAEVVKIKPRWSKKTVVDTKDALYFNPIRRFYPYRLFPNPKGGFFPIGFGKLLSRTESASDRLLASIIDTAQTEGENGGVMGGSQFAIPDKIEVKNNRITTVPTDGQPLDSIMKMWPTKSVSAGSVQVLEKLMTLGDRIAGTLNVMENAPASMSATLAKGIIDDGTQVQSAAHRRLVASMTQEFREFVRMADAYDMLPAGISASDGNGVAVTADPQLATEMQRSALASVFMEMLKAPMIFNPQKTGLSFLQTVRVPNPESFIVPPQPPQATPWEKMQGAVHLMKQRTEAIKVTGAVAVQLTQALLNMVEAAGGMQNNQMALLTMAQLEQAVQQMMEQAGNAGTELNGMGQQSGNQSPGGLPPAQTNGGGPGVPQQPPGGPGDAGAGSGLQ